MKILVILSGLWLSAPALAQDYGLTIGIHQTTAAVDTSTVGTWTTGFQGSPQGKLNFDAGLSASFELVPNLRFRTGLLYDQRTFNYQLANGAGNVAVNFTYFDVPVDMQYNFNEMVGIYGGLVVGIKSSDSVSLPNGASMTNGGPNMASLYPLLNGGVNFLFNDQFGFDVFYEYGLGNFADGLKNYSTYGMHFTYWL